jgi:hypothetical protein
MFWGYEGYIPVVKSTSTKGKLQSGCLLAALNRKDWYSLEMISMGDILLVVTLDGNQIRKLNTLLTRWTMIVQAKRKR